MSERMHVIWAIGLIAAVDYGAFSGLRVLAAGGQQTTMESGLSVPAQSGGAGLQSAPVVAAAEEPTPAPESAPEDPAPAPTPTPVATNPYYIVPISPQRAVPNDDDDDNDDDYDGDTDD